MNIELFHSNPYDVPKSVMTASVTCSTGNTMICAFKTKGISDAVGNESLKKPSYNILALYHYFKEIMITLFSSRYIVSEAR